MASVKFRLKSPHKTTSLIVVRVYSKQTGPLDFSTGENIPPAFWEGQRVSSKYKKQADRINKTLSTLESDLLDVWRDNKAANKETLKALFTKAVKGEIVQEKKTVIEAVKKFIAQYAQEKESTTVKMYRSILKKLEAYNQSLTFSDLDFNFYDAFKKFLYGQSNPCYSGWGLFLDRDTDEYIARPVVKDGPKGHPIGLFDDTVYKYLVHLKTICAWAEKRGYQVHSSYKEWAIIKRDYPVISLTLDELLSIEALQNLPRHLSIALDVFSVCCRTGQRISDVKRLSSLAISQNTWIIHQKKGSRQKQKIVQLPLSGFCEPVKDIVAKYGGKLPEILEQHLNQHIKTLCELAGITQEIFIERWQGNKKIRIPGKKSEFIHLHTGKATFITILSAAGTPLSVLSDFTGTSQKTIEKHYLGRTPLYVAESYLNRVEGKAVMKKAN